MMSSIENLADLLHLDQFGNSETVEEALSGDISTERESLIEFPPFKNWTIFLNRLQQIEKNPSEKDEFWSNLTANMEGGNNVTEASALLAIISECVKELMKSTNLKKTNKKLSNNLIQQAFIASTSYITLIDLPGSAAYNVCDSRILHLIFSVMKGFTAKIAAIQEGSESLAVEDEEDNEDNNPDNDEDNLSEEDDEEEFGHNSRRSRRKKKQNKKKDEKNMNWLFTSKHFFSLLGKVEESLEDDGAMVSILASSEDLMIQLCEALSTVLALSPCEKSRGIAKNILVQISCCTQRKGYDIPLRNMMPQILMKANAKGFPSGAKGKTQIYQRSVEVFVDIVDKINLDLVESENEFDSSSDRNQSEMEDKEKVDQDTREGNSNINKNEHMEEEFADEKKILEQYKKHRGFVLIIAALQQICLEGGGDRADVRGKFIDFVIGSIEHIETKGKNLPATLVFLTFLEKLFQSVKPSHRTFAIELSVSLVKNNLAWNSAYKCHMSTKVLEALSSRIMDKSPTARVRSVVCLSELLNALRYEKDTPPPLEAAIKQILERGIEGSLLFRMGQRCEDDKAVVRKASVQALEVLLTLKAESGTISRKDITFVEAVSYRCRDNSILVRKQALSSLSTILLNFSDNDKVQQIWVRSILPLVSDAEQSVLNRLVEVINDIILEGVLDWRENYTMFTKKNNSRSSNRIEVDSTKVSESQNLWALLAKCASPQHRKCLQVAISLLLSHHINAGNSGIYQKLNKVTEALKKAAELTLLGKEDNNLEGCNLFDLRRGTWALLEAIILAEDQLKGRSTTSDRKKNILADPSFVISCWKDIYEILKKKQDYLVEDDGRKVLRVLSKVAHSINDTIARELRDELLSSLLNLDNALSSETHVMALQAIMALTQRRNDNELRQSIADCEKIGHEILDSCELTLRSYVIKGERGSELVDKVERAVCLSGAVTITGFSASEEENVSTLNDKGKQTNDGDIFLKCIPRPSLIALVRVLLAPELLPESDDDKSINGISSYVPKTKDSPSIGRSVSTIVPEKIRANAFIALGKMCLRSRNLAKENVQLFVRELSVANTPAIRSNAIVILGDLCVRYTSLVERHIPAMAKCLQDNAPMVRRHALQLISVLLLQDYVKWRGLLLQRYLTMLVDNDRDIVSKAEYLIFGPLLNKSPLLLVNHFVEVLVVLNGCTDHPTYKIALKQGAESGTSVTMEGISLEGESNSRKRFSIYTSMLERMSDEQKIQVTAKITKDILAAAGDEESEGEGVKIRSHNRGIVASDTRRREMLMTKLKRDEDLIRDSLCVLRCRDIKVNAGRASADGMDEEDTAADERVEMAASEAVAAAKSRLLTKVSRKHLMERVIPTLVTLKECLEKAHSPLIRDVMEYFIDLFRTYKEEVKEVLSSDPTLFHEIEYDLSLYEKEAKQKKEDENLITKKIGLTSNANINSNSNNKNAAPLLSSNDGNIPSIKPNSGISQGCSLANSGVEVPNTPAPSRALGSNKIRNRRRSSVGIAAAKTPLADALNSSQKCGAKVTPSLASVSAPKVRKSSTGIENRTPSEAILEQTTSVKNEGGSSTNEGKKKAGPIAITPIPLRRSKRGTKKNNQSISPESKNQVTIDLPGMVVENESSN